MIDCREIPVADNVEQAVATAVRDGAIIMRSCINVDAFIELMQKDMGGTIVSGSRNEFCQKLREQESADFDIIRSIEQANTGHGQAPYSHARLTTFETAHVLPPHVDNFPPSIGLTALLPIYHGGEVWLHTDDFPGKLSPDALRVTHKSRYGPGDLMLLRQSIPNLGKAAVIHSSNGVRLESDNNQHLRLLFSLDTAL